MIDPRIVGNFVLDKASARGRQITNLDLQKIVYFMHGHHLSRHGEPLVLGQFEAWTYGPVHRVLYDAFKRYGDGPIEDFAAAYNPISRRQLPLPKLDDSRAISIVHDFLNRYLDRSTYTLVQLTHAEGTPWSKTVQEAEEHVNFGMRIDNSLIAECFEGDR